MNEKEKNLIVGLHICVETLKRYNSIVPAENFAE